MPYLNVLSNFTCTVPVPTGTAVSVASLVQAFFTAFRPNDLLFTAASHVQYASSKSSASGGLIYIGDVTMTLGAGPGTTNPAGTGVGHELYSGESYFDNFIGPANYDLTQTYVVASTSGCFLCIDARRV